MSETVVYGLMPSEKLAEENLQCRQVVKEIQTFGVSDRQLKKIVYLLSLEIENIEQMQAITSCIKDVCGSEIFVSDVAQLD
jgi:hypothetical protein